MSDSNFRADSKADEVDASNTLGIKFGSSSVVVNAQEASVIPLNQSMLVSSEELTQDHANIIYSFAANSQFNDAMGFPGANMSYPLSMLDSDQFHPSNVQSIEMEGTLGESSSSSSSMNPFAYASHVHPLSSMSEAEISEYRCLMHHTVNQYWSQQLTNIRNTVVTSEHEFKGANDLPLARIKRIMKSDEDVKMISAEVPVLFAKACELFISDLTLRAWSHSEKNKRKTLQREDVQAAVIHTDIFDFLADSIN